jgi:hypothetical protein
MFYDNKHSPEVQEWCYRLINDPEYFEKFRYIDSINDYNSIIEEFAKLYEQTPANVTAASRFMRARCLKGIKRTQRELAKTQAEYDAFKQILTTTDSVFSDIY